MKKTALVLLLIVATTILTLHPRKHGKKEFFIMNVGKGVSKTGATLAGTTAEFGVKVSDETLESFSKSFDDLLSGNKTIDTITGSDLEDIAKQYDAFKNLNDWDDVADAIKKAYKKNRYKVFDDYVVDTRKLDDIDSLPEETQVKIIEDAEKRLNKRFDNLPSDEQMFKTWKEITFIRKGQKVLKGDIKKADIAKTIDEYVELRGKPLTQGSDLQVFRKSLDDPSKWRSFVDSPAWTKIAAGSALVLTLAGILIGIFVRPTYVKNGGDTGYDPYTGECDPGNLECVAAEWMDWITENATMFGLASCASMCMCICCCCMLSLVLIMDGENNNSGYL